MSNQGINALEFITYIRGTSTGLQKNWATMTKEADAIYMALKFIILTI